PSGRPVALITGASSGIGRAYAERLAADGHDLVVVARRGDRLDELKRRLESERGVSVQTLVADLATGSGMRDVDAAAADRRVQTVVDCAALAHYMPFLNLPSETAQELVTLNVLAPVRLIRAALPSMVERGSGTVITFASQLVFSATAANPQLPQRAVYTATKAFIFTFIRLLAAELRDTGVRLQVVCPGVVKTEFHTRQRMDMSHMPRMEPDQVVRASMIALERGEIVCIPTLEDADTLTRRDEAELAIFSSGMRPKLAERYSDG
ncbi:MAG: SDR family NAD(P)-dependent oxidoreductase, partial [Candidatus Limnocylindria bacterium]